MSELLIEPASIARLVRLFLAATPAAEDTSSPPGNSKEEGRQEAGSLLWDISVIEDGAATMLGFSVVEAAEAVLTAALEGSATPRDAELALGILANLAAFPHISTRLLRHAALAELVCEGVLQQITDPPALSEACRLLSALCSPQVAAPWASRLCTMPVLERLLWIATNTLDATLQQRCLELLSALLQAQQSLTPALCAQGLPAVLVEALTHAAKVLVSQSRRRQVGQPDASGGATSPATEATTAAHDKGTAAHSTANGAGVVQHSSWSDDEDAAPATHSGWTDAADAIAAAAQPSRLGADAAEALACAALACLQELGGSAVGRQAVAQQQPLASAALELLHCEAAAVLGRLMVALTLHEQALLPQLAASPMLIQALSHVPGQVDLSDEDALDGAWYLLAAALTHAAEAAGQPAARQADSQGAQRPAGAGADGQRAPAAAAPPGAGASTAAGTGSGDLQQTAVVGEAAGGRGTRRSELLSSIMSMASRLADSPLPSTSRQYGMACCKQMLVNVQTALNAPEREGGVVRGQLEAAQTQLLAWQGRLQQQQQAQETQVAKDARGSTPSS